MSLVWCIGKSCTELNSYNPKLILQNSSNEDFVSFLIHLFASVIAGYIAWHRAGHMALPWRLIITVLAFMFGILYLIYLVGVVMVGDSLFKKTYLVNMAESEMDRLANTVTGGTY